MNLFRKLLSFAFVAFAFSFYLPASFAHFSQGVCKADADKFCATSTGHGERWQCLSSHQSELSQDCQTKMEKIKARKEAFRKDCSADAAKYCSSTGDDFWAKKKCLMPHKTELSAVCQGHFQHKM